MDSICDCLPGLLSVDLLGANYGLQPFCGQRKKRWRVFTPAIYQRAIRCLKNMVTIAVS